MKEVKVSLSKIFEIESGVIAIIFIADQVRPIAGNVIKSSNGETWVINEILAHYIPLEGHTSELDKFAANGEWHCKLQPTNKNTLLQEGDLVLLF